MASRTHRISIIKKATQLSRLFYYAIHRKNGREIAREGRGHCNGKTFRRFFRRCQKSQITNCLDTQLRAFQEASFRALYIVYYKLRLGMIPPPSHNLLIIIPYILLCAHIKPNNIQKHTKYEENKSCPTAITKF
jgi:hypothetical protein